MIYKYIHYTHYIIYVGCKHSARKKRLDYERYVLSKERKRVLNGWKWKVGEYCDYQL